MDKHAIERNRMRFEQERKLQATNADLLAALKAYQGSNRIHNDSEAALFSQAHVAIAKAEEQT